jgi:DNA-directed RNA polymerase subunit RPC12/RpoP
MKTFDVSYLEEDSYMRCPLCYHSSIFCFGGAQFTLFIYEGELAYRCLECDGSFKLNKSST